MGLKNVTNRRNRAYGIEKQKKNKVGGELGESVRKRQRAMT